MNNKESILNNHSNIRKQSFNITASEGYKDVNKHYKAIRFSLEGDKTKHSQKDPREPSYSKPLRLIVLEFNTFEKDKKPYSIDVSSFFNKPFKSVVLKYSKKIKISKKFGHWVKRYPMDPIYNLLKKECEERGLHSIHDIVGSDLSMHEYVLYIDLRLKSIPLTKSHISCITAQTLCKTRYTNKNYQTFYTATGGVLGAFILKNTELQKNMNPIVIGYFISDYELKQCALANFTKKQSVEITHWPPSVESSKEKIGQLNNLLGDSSENSELLRASAPSESTHQIVTSLWRVLNRGSLKSATGPIYKLIGLLTKLS